MIPSATTKTAHFSTHSSLRTVSPDCHSPMRRRQSSSKRRWTTEKRMLTGTQGQNHSVRLPVAHTAELVLPMGSIIMDFWADFSDIGIPLPLINSLRTLSFHPER